MNRQDELNLDVDQEFTNSVSEDEESFALKAEPSKQDFTLTHIVESILFVAPKALSIQEIREIVDPELMIPLANLHQALEQLDEIYQSRGIELTKERDRYQFKTVARLHPYVERMFMSRPRPLSKAAQETLAIIAYRQPATRADIEFIRGVDAGTIIKNLLERGLVKCVGRKEDVGRPMLFATTEEFLRVYNLDHLSDLPPIESFQPAHDKVKKALEKLETGIESGEQAAKEAIEEVEKNMV